MTRQHSFRFSLLITFALASLPGCAAGPKPLPDACNTPLSSALTNACVVSKDVLWRGARPNVQGATALLELKVGSVVNLEMLHDDWPVFKMAQPQISEATGLDYYRIKEWEPNVVIAPNILDTHVADFLATMKTARKPVYVHCRSGQNRTGVMVASYRVLVEGMAVEAAIAEMQKYNGIWFKQDAAYIRGLAGERGQKIKALAEAKSTGMLPQTHLACTSKGCQAAK